MIVGLRIVLHSCVMFALFPGMSQKSIALLGLIPAVLCENTSTDLMHAVDMYRACLPEPDLLETELIRYKQRYAKQQSDERHKQRGVPKHLCTVTDCM